MYSAKKKSGKNKYLFFNEEMQTIFNYIIIPLQNRTNIINDNGTIKYDLIRDAIIKVNLYSNKIKIILDLGKINNLNASRLATHLSKQSYKTYWQESKNKRARKEFFYEHTVKGSYSKFF